MVSALRRALPHLREAARAFVRPAEGSPARRSGGRRATVVALALVAAVGIFLATTRLEIKGRWYGLYLMHGIVGRPFVLADDLRLGDGPRLIGGVSFSHARELFASREERLPRLELDWDEEEGGGVVNNVLRDGRVLQTVLGRYVEDKGDRPAGLFVGGASADVASGTELNESGMSLKDPRGWHHVWCSVNEGVLLYQSGRMIFPGEWDFRGSRVLVRSTDRVVLESTSEIQVDGAHLRMERYAYFKAGRPWFRLGISLVNLGDSPVSIAFAYGDEPWVGEYGSAAGNVGWSPQGLHESVGFLDPREVPGAGILDLKSGLAAFIGWEGNIPSRAYFGNHPGTPAPEELGSPLQSNEITIGLEWLERTILPGDELNLRLTIGLADGDGSARPSFPAGSVPRR